MILVDPQGPDGAFLLDPLLALGLPAREQRLDSADLAFVGRGAGETTVNVGIEFKRMDSKSTDLIQSLRSGRLAGGQLPKMLGPNGAYDYAWLLIEGTWRHDADGLVSAYYGPRRGWCKVPGKMSATELEKHVLTLELCGGLHVRFTNSRRDSIRFIGALYRWWSDKSLDSHTTHLAIHDTPTLVPISEFRQVVARLPGIGIKTSLAVEARFASLSEAFAAGVNEWAAITTGDKRLGLKTATRVVEFIRRRHNGKTAR